VKHDPHRNVFISPSSVAIALAMTYNGARDGTQQAMATTLGLQGMSLDEVNRAHRTLREALTHPDPHVQLAVADALFERKGITLNPDFVRRNETFYRARVAALDFRDPRAPAIINGWVSSQTHGKIRKLIDRIDPM